MRSRSHYKKSETHSFFLTFVFFRRKRVSNIGVRKRSMRLDAYWCIRMHTDAYTPSAEPGPVSSVWPGLDFHTRQKITYLPRKKTYSNRKFDIIDLNNLLIQYLFLVWPFITNYRYYMLNTSVYMPHTQY